MTQASAPAPIKNVLITGGCGRIGSYFAKFAAGRYNFRMVDRVAWDARKRGPFPGETHVGDLTNLGFCRKMVRGMDAVMHLAADPDPAATMESLLPNNIIVTYNMFTAAAEAGCRRFIFASSVHAIEGYPEDVEVRPDMPVRPKNLYGVTKCYGEALGIYFAYTHNLPTVAVRFGAHIHPDPSQPLYPLSLRDLKIFVHPDDLNELLALMLDNTSVQFAIVHAASDNQVKRLNIDATIRDFGYAPQADSYKLFDTRKAKLPNPED